MTSDAKVGLLLGLVFIFVIAFLINGLPKLGSEKNSNELTAAMANLKNSSPAIGQNERKVISPEPAGQENYIQVPQEASRNSDVRFEMPLPQSTQAQQDGVSSQNQSDQEIQPSVLTADKEDLEAVPPAPKAELPKVYVVKEGDNMTLIAKAVYGSESGSKADVVNMIFQANKERVKSMDEIFPGQKLLIPPLSVSRPGAGTAGGNVGAVLSSGKFEKVESVGQRHILNKSKAKKTSRYAVKEGDSLWKIAANKLGNGSRFTEIAKLNSDILSDEDSVFVGMVLNLPVR